MSAGWTVWLGDALQATWQRRGAIAWLLRPLSALYGAAVALSSTRFRSGADCVADLPVPVVVVGNLIAGGAGKTPSVIAVVQRLQAAGRTPGVISRGYGRTSSPGSVIRVEARTPADECGDEPLLLQLRLKVPVFVGSDRVAAARALLAAHPEVDVLVSDDGLQHRRLPRCAQVIVFDERGIGNGWLLPAGPLREPLPPALPSNSVVVYNARQPTMAWPGHTARRQLAGVVELAPWWAGRQASLGALADLAASGRPVLAAAGVARPDRFFDLLQAAGLAFTPLRLPDHHDYATLPWPVDAGDVVVTEKDAVKLQPQRVATERPATRVWVAPLDFHPDSTFDAALLALLPTSASTRTPDGHPTA